MNQNTTDIDTWIPTIQTLLEGSGRVQVIWDREYLEVKEALTKAIEADNDFLCDKLDVKAETDLLCYHLEEFSRADTTYTEAVWLQAVMHIICTLGMKWYLRDTVVKFIIYIGPKLMTIEGDHEEMFFIVEEGMQAVINSLKSKETIKQMLDSWLATSYLIGLIKDDGKADKFVRRIYDFKPGNLSHYLEFFLTSGLILRDDRKTPSTIPFETGIDHLFTKTEEAIKAAPSRYPCFEEYYLEANEHGLRNMRLLLRPIAMENSNEECMELLEIFLIEAKKYLSAIEAGK